MDYSKLTIKDTAKLYRSGDLKVIDLVNYYLDIIKEKNDDINAYLEIYDDVVKQAENAQKRIDDGEEGEMIGIPIGLKDNILVEGKKASAASKILEGYVATYTATAANKLLDAGAVILGRTNMDEFAMGGSTENSAFGVTKNPVDLDRVAGGSSGGSAAALAMDGCLASFGSDTGGSIRQPASFCGVVGLKPTYGSVSRHGLMAMASSLDVIGPFSKTVEDAEILFNVVRGKDEKDSTTVEGEVSGEVKKVGVPREFLEGVDEGVLKNFNESLEKLKREGYEIVDVDLPNLKYALSVYYVLMPAEVSSNMARYDGIKYGNRVEGKDLVEGYFNTRGELLGPEVKRRIMLGTYVLSAGYSDEYYKKAWVARNLIKNDFDKAYEEVDVIAMPTSPVPAFKIGERSDPLQMYLADIFTIPANLAGIPAISIPDGFVDNLPTGLQILAPKLGENKLFEVGKKFECIKSA